MASLVRVEFESTTGLSKDRFVNNFAVMLGTPTSATWRTSVGNLLRDFYNTSAGGSTEVLAAYLSHQISRAADACTVKFYDVETPAQFAGGPLGSPIGMTTFTLAAPATGSQPLPSQVALVVTLEAAGRGEQPVERPDGVDPGAEVDRPKQRYTGRLYIGPLNTAANLIENDTSRPNNTFRQLLMDAVNELADGLFALTPSSPLAVWSRTDAVFRNIDAVSIDNRWDTQRSRALAPTVRSRIAV